MNQITLRGFIVTEVKVNRGIQGFRLKVSDGKDKEGKPKSFFVSIRVFSKDRNLDLRKDDFVMLEGRLSISQFEGKEYAAILCSASSVSVIKRGAKKAEPQEPPIDSYDEYPYEDYLP